MIKNTRARAEVVRNMLKSDNLLNLPIFFGFKYTREAQQVAQITAILENLTQLFDLENVARAQKV